MAAVAAREGSDHLRGFSLVAEQHYPTCGPGYSVTGPRAGGAARSATSTRARRERESPRARRSLASLVVERLDGEILAGGPPRRLFERSAAVVALVRRPLR